MLIDSDKLIAYIQEKGGAVPFAKASRIINKNFFTEDVLKELQPAPEVVAPKIPIEEISVQPRIRVRSFDHSTSWEAAISISPEKSRLIYQRIYDSLKRFGPSTDTEIRNLYETQFLDSVSPSGLRTRRAELVATGWVVATDEKRLNHRNRREMVWKAVETS
jgi:hypothetical protein